MAARQIYDYLIVGAGVLGSATAKHLQDAEPGKKILLVDKYPACGQGNTSKSNACYRNVFDTTMNIELCNASIEYYKHVEKTTNVGLKEFGYLWLLTETQMKNRQVKKITKDSDQTKYSLLDFLETHQVKFRILPQPELKEIFPSLQLDGGSGEEGKTIRYGLLGNQCGALSPDLLVQYYESEYKQQGGETRYNLEVTEILLKEKNEEFDEDYFPTVWRESEVAGVKVKNVKTHEEQIIKAEKVILCTGAWVNQLLYKIGIHVGINAKKRQLFRIANKKAFVINTAFENKFTSIPFIILPEGGVFIKPISDNGSVDVGCSDDVGRSFEQEPLLNAKNDPFKNKLDNPRGELEFYQTDVLPVLKNYFPIEFNEKVPIEHPSAGMYAYSMDKFPVITKELGNLFICSGASGSGIMKGDAIARINVANILGQEQCTLFNGTSVRVKDFGLHGRNVPEETLIL